MKRKIALFLALVMLAAVSVIALPVAAEEGEPSEADKEAAQKVAEKLAALSRGRQVLCVTHLPQLAALADTHLLISKEVRDGRTYTTVTPLDMEGRKWELARIVGGTNITETTLKSAEEMLKA